MPRRHAGEFGRILGSHIRAEMIRRILEAPDGMIWLRELYRAVGSMSCVRRECDRLISLGVIRNRRDGGACFFHVVDGNPLVPALRHLMAACDEFDPPRDSSPLFSELRPSPPERTRRVFSQNDYPQGAYPQGAPRPNSSATGAAPADVRLGERTHCPPTG